MTCSLRHIDLTGSWIKKKVADGTCVLVKVDSVNNNSDIGTKRFSQSLCNALTHSLVEYRFFIIARGSLLFERWQWPDYLSSNNSYYLLGEDSWLLMNAEKIHHISLNVLSISTLLESECTLLGSESITPEAISRQKNLRSLATDFFGSCSILNSTSYQYHGKFWCTKTKKR